jgi:hypothetical protein
MSAKLAEALRPLNLQPGQIYHTTVNGCEVELRVFAPIRSAATPEETSDYADCVMLEPWVEFPRPPTAGTVIEMPGPQPLPDPPMIPTEEEGGT